MPPPACPLCAAAPHDARFCPACGQCLSGVPSRATIAASDAATCEPLPDTFAASCPRPFRSPPSQPWSGDVRFVPGTLLAGRYRIVGLLGRGGMGEVYRADDLTLGQPVALKFLPLGFANSRARLERFRAEVSLARQVSHPNACRVYDIGETDGVVFLSMEYIDGEDLGSLLRRIGRLPEDKGVEIARQICAGLAAAHDRGIVHRDLKPGNVMIDGRGHARIADFGLALDAEPLAAGGHALSELAGTPAYMAPEQFEGRPASVASDIYALGLVLYEVFTGKRTFEGRTFADIAEAHRHRTPSGMTSLVAELDPVIERAIARCLAKDPAERPRSALAVSASLPGGDPLAAALVRGETPSPEMVAAAGTAGLVKRWHAVAALGGVLACLVAAVTLGGFLDLRRLAPLPKSPEVLLDRARNIVAALGYAQSGVDSASGFVASAYVAHVDLSERWRARADHLRAGEPAALLYWYRQAAASLYPLGIATRVTQFDPPETEPGMAGLSLDTFGRLRRFVAVPARFGETGNLVAPDWSVLFREAGLDGSRFHAVTPRVVPPVFADTRTAWEGAFSKRPDVRLHLEAAALHGRIVYFEALDPWSEATTGPQQPVNTWWTILFVQLLLLAVLTSAMLLATRNLRMGRGDRRGAFRIALFLFLASVAGSLLDAHGSPDVAMAVFGLAITASMPALMTAGSAWLAYIALEPYVRRRSPRLLIAWTRLLSGRWHDPLVGRDLLVGVLVGLLAFLYQQVATVVSLRPYSGETSAWVLDGLRFVLAAALLELQRATVAGLAVLLLLFCLTLVTRRTWLAVVIAIGVLCGNMAAMVTQNSLPGLVAAAVFGGFFVALLLRYGVLALIAALFTGDVMLMAPLTFDLSCWFAPSSVVVMAIVVGLAVFGAWTSGDLRSLVPTLLSD